MDSTRWTIIGAVTVALAAVGIFWATLPESGPPTVAPPPPAPAVARAKPPAPSVKPSPRPRGPKARPARAPRAEAQPAAAPEPGSVRARLQEARDHGDPIPEDVLQRLDEARAERVALSAEKIARYAELAEWDADTTAAVQGLVDTAHDEVDALLADASAGEVPWSEVKGEMRRIRIDQARAVREELGDEAFRRFAKAMGRSRGRRGGRR